MRYTLWKTDLEDGTVNIDEIFSDLAQGFARVVKRARNFVVLEVQDPFVLLTSRRRRSSEVIARYSKGHIYGFSPEARHQLLKTLFL